MPRASLAFGALSAIGLAFRALSAIGLAFRALSAIGLPVVLVLALSVAPAGAAVPAWTTYDHDGSRTATDPDSAAPISPTAAWSTEPQLDGPVYAQPLVVGSVVYVGTENDTIYALDAATGALLWQRGVGTPVPATTKQYLPCGDIGPTVGITSTPAIDTARGRLYAVADTLAGGVIQHELVALDLSTGAPVAGFPVAVDPPGADPKALLQRAALVLDQGRVIVPYGGNAGDCGNYHGWLVSAAQDSPTSQSSFEVDPATGERGGAIWGSGDGPSLDSAGHVFVSTGNGFSSAATPDLQESVVELDPTLNVTASWTASNWKALDNSDADLGSSEPLPLPDGLLFAVGKDGVGRLLSADALGSVGQVFSAPACASGGAFGASLYSAGVIYVPCSGGLAALALSTAPNPSFTPAPGWSAPAGASGPPIFAGGLVWSTGWRSSGILYGLDPGTGAVRYQSTLGTFNHFATPSAGGGRLFVAVGSQLAALQISSFPPATGTTLTSSRNPAPLGSPPNLIATVSPAPDAGTVSFAAGGKALPGCGAVDVAPSTGQASCRAPLAVGAHHVVATYSGDPYFAGSVSATLTQVVTARPGPRISALALTPRRFTARRGTVLKLRLSEAARLRVSIDRRLTGHRVRSRCRLELRRGRRCTVLLGVRRLELAGRPGHNRFRLELRRLAPGRYLARIVALDAAGLRSRTISVGFEILRP